MNTVKNLGPSLTQSRAFANKERNNMADEDIEMENFSEDRAETASDFTADDENEKVTRLKFFFLRLCV